MSETLAVLEGLLGGNFLETEELGSAEPLLLSSVEKLKGSSNKVLKLVNWFSPW